MTPEDAVRRLQGTLAHLWMVRTFLKHADEVQEDEALLEVPRALFDHVRAVEPAFARGDWKDYLRRLKGKLPKLRRAAETLAAEWRRVSAHTNFEMAAASLSEAVTRIAEVLDAVEWPRSAAPAPPEPPSSAAGPAAAVPGGPAMHKRGPRYSKEEFVRRGWEWYRTVIKPKVFAGNKGRHLLIDIETGDYEVDDDPIAATERLYARRPDAQPFGIRIGYLATYSRGGVPLPEDPE